MGKNGELQGLRGMYSQLPRGDHKRPGKMTEKKLEGQLSRQGNEYKTRAKNI